MKYISIPPLKRRQKEIPSLIFKFRYINRIQFQTLTHEPHRQNMTTRLKQLTDNKFLKNLYQKKQKTLYTPATLLYGKYGN